MLCCPFAIWSVLFFVAIILQKAVVRVHPQIMPPFHIDEIHPTCTYQSSQQNFPTNPISSSIHSLCTSMLIDIPQQFRYLIPLLHINGRIPERITCSTHVWFSVLTNCLYFLTMAVVSSLSTLFVPTRTKTGPPLPEPMMFSTLSIIHHMLGPGKQTTTSSPCLWLCRSS